MSDSANQQFQAWLEQIRGIGGPNPLTNLDTEVAGLVNLERAHPVGLSLFTRSHRGLLANLVRDPISYSKALTEAKRAKIKSDRLEANFGLETLYLLAGAVDFRHLKLDRRIPIVLWQAELIRKGADFELALTGDPIVNPELILTLKYEFNINLDVPRLLRLYTESTDLAPITLLSFVAEQTKSVPELEIQRTLVVTNATYAPTLMLHDIKRPNSLVEELATGVVPDRHHDKDLIPLIPADADQEQTQVITRVLNGESFAVETLPGTGYTQTVANILGALAGESKRALVLAPRRQTLNELADRLAQIGLSGLMVRAHSTWLDVVSAISRFEKAEAAGIETAQDIQERAAEALDSYFISLHRDHPVLGVSIGDALEKLALLSALPKPPKTMARITGSALFETRNRAQAIALLQEAVELGEFDKENKESPWFNAQFDNVDEVPRIVGLAGRLADDVLPNLGQKLDDFSSQVHFPVAENVSQWGEYLRLLINVRNTLDRFKPEVFDRPLTDLIEATSPRKEKTSMSGKTRRALSKHAKEYVRAGVSVTDLHSQLLQIQEQSEQWQKLCSQPIRPAVLLGLDDAQVVYQSLMADLIKLDSHLDPDPERTNLMELPLAELSSKLRALATETKPLDNLLEKNDLRRRVNDSGLAALVRSLAVTGARNEDLVAEFDQCWWLSALEYLIASDNTFSSYTTERIAELESTFVKADLRLQFESRKQISHRAAVAFDQITAKHQTETEILKSLLKQRVNTIGAFARGTKNIWPILAQHIALSPYEVSEELDQSQFDVVLVMDAAGSTVAENLAGLVRAKQIIAFGDPMIADPNGFEVEWQEELKPKAPEDQSIFAQVSEVYGREVLRKSYRLKGQLFGQLLNREFYQGRLEVEPTAAEFDGKSALELVIVGGDTRATTNRGASTESTEAEVNKVVDLICEHVTNHPDQSLLVVSASHKHVENLHQSLQLALEANPELMEFFQKHGREKFEITTLADLNHRLADRIIFTIGFGLTSNGKVLPHFGLLNEPEAKRWLANMLVSARYRMTIVSCFSAYDLPELKADGATGYLATLLKPIYNESIETDSFDSDPMLGDLARRLKRFGIRVVEGFGQRIPLVASFGNQALIVEPDWANTDLTLSERVRIRPTLLSNLGWGYQRVYSFEVFSDPQSVAERIGTRLGVEITPTMLQTAPVARVYEDTDEAWGEKTQSNDDRLKQDKPPHWG